jgi:ethanolamine utilization cobalamin adenosyltransferase
LQAYTLEYAPYVANLIHQDIRSAIKLVRDSLNIQYYHNVHTVELVEKQIARLKEHLHEPKRLFGAE